MCNLCYGIKEGCPNCDTSDQFDFDDLLDMADEANIIAKELEAEDEI